MPKPSATDAAAHLLGDPERFSSIGTRTLRYYQAQCSRAIIHSVLHQKGTIFTVMFARQMGKNETSAQLEAYLLALYARRGGSIVKAAPSFKPQIVNSLLRLKDTLEGNPLTRNRWRSSFGYMIYLKAATCSFLSADNAASVVGATASVLLEMDEAQDIDPQKYTRDFRPMASTTNATTVLWGTAWSDDCLLETQRQLNVAHDLDNPNLRTHWEFDYRTLAGISPAYKTFVDAEIERLGITHPIIQTQYLLQPLTNAGKLFSTRQMETLHGSHPPHAVPQPNTIYVAGIDIAGEDEQPSENTRLENPRRDSTVITIAAIDRNPSGQSVAHVVHHQWWTGRDHTWQYNRLVDLWNTWQFAHVTIDSSGIGYGIAQFLATKFPDRTESIIFSAPSKSKLAYQLLAMINTNRISHYEGHDPAADECWVQLDNCRYSLIANETMRWGVAPTVGHDDFAIALALCSHAAETMLPPPQSAMIRARPDEYNERW